MQLTLFQNPLLICTFFTRECFIYIRFYCKYLICISIISFIFPIYAYWVFIGILSSCGFGTGFYTGTTVLFPYIINVTLKNDAFMPTFIEVIPYTVLWGIGTAIGEIPPFLVANIIQKRVDEKIKIVEWIKQFVNKYGSKAIFVLACYPNATFDIAGMIAGLSNMSLASFLTATILGKGFVKAPLQIVFVILSTYGIVNTNINITPNLYYIAILWKAFTLLIMLISLRVFVEEIANIHIERLHAKLPEKVV